MCVCMQVRLQDTFIVFAGIVMTREGQDYVWPYFKENTKMLVDKYGSADSSLFQHIFQVCLIVLVRLLFCFIAVLL
jgi:hypothetical protein